MSNDPKKVKHEGHPGATGQAEMKDSIGCNICGLSHRRTQREVSSDLAGFCPSCVDQRQHFRSYEGVFERLVTKHYMKESKMSWPETEQAAREKMAELPAWKDVKM